jgi:farnesyl-diphosphate farnesyltransferase
MTSQLVEQLAAGVPPYRPEELRPLPPEAFCRQLLPHVSRTFAISVPCLPEPLDLQVTVAYLICRLADTIEDSTHWTAASRQEAFADLAEVFAAGDMLSAARRFEQRYGGFAGEAACDLLFQSASKIFEVLAGFDEAIIAAAWQCVCDMIDGMRRTPPARRDAGVARVCESVEQLEQYCHYVAGVVGIMLTEMFDVYLSAGGRFAKASRIEQGRRFGLGLQMTNILVDQVDDARAGKSYLPELASLPAGRRVPALVERARTHLDEAMEYTLALPSEPAGLRVFCLLPLFFALRTLELVCRKNAGQLSADRPKISRDDVLRIAERVYTNVAADDALRTWYRQQRRA